MKKWSAAMAAVLVLFACKREPPPPMADANPEPPRGTLPWKLHNARSAAPSDISANATIMDVAPTDTSARATLVQGENGWTCFPDNPGTDANDPFCVDEEGTRWMEAHRVRRAPRLNGMAIAYALQGGVSASDRDPFKMAPDSGQQWLVDGPSIYIAMPNARSYAGLPTTRRSDGPWVKYAGTPYAYIVIPAGTR